MIEILLKKTSFSFNIDFSFEQTLIIVYSRIKVVEVLLENLHLSLSNGGTHFVEPPKGVVSRISRCH